MRSVIAGFTSFLLLATLTPPVTRFLVDRWGFDVFTFVTRGYFLDKPKFFMQAALALVVLAVAYVIFYKFLRYLVFFSLDPRRKIIGIFAEVYPRDGRVVIAPYGVYFDLLSELLVVKGFGKSYDPELGSASEEFQERWNSNDVIVDSSKVGEINSITYIHFGQFRYDSGAPGPGVTRLNFNGNKGKGYFVSLEKESDFRCCSPLEVGGQPSMSGEFSKLPSKIGFFYSRLSCAAVFDGKILRNFLPMKNLQIMIKWNDELMEETAGKIAGYYLKNPPDGESEGKNDNNDNENDGENNDNNDSCEDSGSGEIFETTVVMEDFKREIERAKEFAKERKNGKEAKG
ncbi:hypothetical protein [Ruegeria arenilitoris]|uniref:hypothetical protein n=1 Tax=Ruegeria arenilitoris TaxID=1173585 RepID=UPI00147A44E7|nr:hypothetical protein [Ruegeria arenilitoris]